MNPTVNDNPSLELSRLADGIERIANVIAPRPTAPQANLMLDVEVMSSKTEYEIVESNRRKCVTYTIASSEEDAEKYVSMSIRFLLKQDPKWRAGQRIKIGITEDK
jgi:hypothetical protein